MRLFAVFAVVAGSCAAQDQVPSKPPYRLGGGVSAPSVIFKVEPEYSKDAAKARVEGTVVLFVVVDEKGNPSNLKIIRPLGHGLDEKAAEAVEQWRFKPGMKERQPVAVQATIEINFRIHHGWRLVDISFQTPEGVSRPTADRQKYPESTEGQASITLSFDVDERGLPSHLRVEKSSDPTREAEVLAAVNEWVFSPGIKNGKAVAVPCTATFVLGEVGK